MAGVASAWEKLALDPTFEAVPSSVPKPETGAAQNVAKSSQVNFNRSHPGNQKTLSAFNASPGKTGIGSSFKPSKFPKFSLRK